MEFPGTIDDFIGYVSQQTHPVWPSSSERCFLAQYLLDELPIGHVNVKLAVAYLYPLDEPAQDIVLPVWAERFNHRSTQEDMRHSLLSPEAALEVLREVKDQLAYEMEMDAVYSYDLTGVI